MRMARFMPRPLPVPSWSISWMSSRGTSRLFLTCRPLRCITSSSRSASEDRCRLRASWMMRGWRQLDLFGYWPFEHTLRSLNPIFFYDSLDHPVVIFFQRIERMGVECIAKHIHRFAKVGYGDEVSCAAVCDVEG